MSKKKCVMGHVLKKDNHSVGLGGRITCNECTKYMVNSRSVEAKVKVDPRTEVEEKLTKYSEVDAKTGCWNWVGSLNGSGYGQLRMFGKTWMTHSLSYEFHYNQPISFGMVIDHLCRNPACINPAHLEMITQHSHRLRTAPFIRGVRRRYKADDTHCKHGHAWTEENTYIAPSGSRVCRECQKIGARKFYKKASHKISQSEVLT